ncbi:exonuclease SbcC [Geomicrobium halophilum]|uniref:Nuclease SbcCD subunit C n=1 Tax=Geomicrobium halophilum TaxID=549000 RepID=A0A841PJT2_9BACL|nr:SMC family ATPase [Geomicrobium halophilum]MBB6449127.1 exonuclease SbcC [Geomicrobium halophilum]
MRPLTLNIRGLHSFRESQTIDFNRLCSGGVFGIFGPTGSGKSSILDAMTFALFGRISRSGAASVSMINQSESEVAVSFSFRLGHRSFTAERRAKRKENQLKTTRSRFIETTNEPVVLAEKTGDMNHHIEKMLGLKLDDFTRTVVLPQNKFSEFLSLKGTERSEMLQRLFDLHKYGDELNEKIKTNLTHVSARKGEIEGEQTGLGDASKEALSNAKQAVVQIENELHKETEVKEELERRFQEAKETRKQQQFHKELLDELHNLDRERPAHEGRLQALHLSNSASRLLPYIEEKDRTEQARSEAEEAFAANKNKVEKCAKEERNAKQIFTSAREKRQVEEPQLTVRISQLEEAKTIEVQLQTSENQLERERKNEEALRKQQRAANDQLAHAKEEEAAAKQVLQEKENKVSTLDQKQPTHEKIRQAYEKATALNEQAKRLGEEQASEQKAIENMQQQERQMHEEKEKVEQFKEKLQASQANLTRWYFDLSEASREQHSLIQIIKEMTSNRINTHHAEIIRTLAAQLEDGKACPVCGSDHHPYPEDPSALEGDTDDESLRETYDHLQTDLRIEQYLWKLDQVSAQISMFLDTDATALGLPETNEKTGPSHPLLRSEAPGMLQQRVQRFIRQLDAKTRSLDSLLEDTNRQLEKFQQHHSRVKEDEIRYEQTKLHYEEADARKTRQKEVYQTIEKEWYEAFPDQSLDNIHKAWEMAQHEQEQLQSLRAEVRDHQNKLESLRENMKEAESRQANIQMQLVQKQTERKQHEQQQRQEQEKLGQMLGEFESATKALREAEDTLQTMQKEEKRAEETFQNAAAQLQKAEQEQSAVEKQRTTAIHQHEQAMERWKQQQNSEAYHEVTHLITKSDHTEITSEDIKKCCLTEKERKRYEEETTDFETHLSNTRYRLTEVEKNLDGKSITDEEWQTLHESFQQKQDRVDQLKEERSVARSKWEELKEKHHRYQTLEENRQELATQIGHYKELERVFRGKAFVEFIAEEHLVQVTRSASERLHTLTQGRYALALDSNGGFLIADYFNGGEKRPPSTLSGGETFLTSLALALSLSASIQLKGQYPLEFFFLDEGFGTLDGETLDTVVTSLEQLQTEYLAVGVISHVPELQERLHKRLLVEAPTPEGTGSRLTIQN